MIRCLLRAPGLQAGFDAGPVITHDLEFCAESGATCGIECGTGAPYGIRCLTWDPGLSPSSRIPCGIQCGIMGFNVTARTSNVIPTSVRDPTREHRCRAGPGLPCGGQSGILDPARDPEFRPSSNAGSFTCDVFHSVRYPTLSWLRSERGALGRGTPLV